MSWIDWLIVIVVAVLFIGALVYIRRNGTCTDDCSSCHGACHSPKRKKASQEVPAFVEAYRKDHPKQNG